MADLYKRLYKYRERAANAPLENFLTEALADILERLPIESQVAFLKSLMLPKAASAFDTVVSGRASLEFVTQASASTKRPDLVVYAGERPIVVIEVKVAAGLQEHEVEAAAVNAEAKATRNQLETYAGWIAGENMSSDVWPGAVVFLTGRTDPPKDFIEGRSDGVFRSVRYWKHVGDWLLSLARSQPRGLTHRDLATE